MHIKIVFNPFYEITDNLISLWMAKSYFVDDFLILNGDTVFIRQFLGHY